MNINLVFTVLLAKLVAMFYHRVEMGTEIATSLEQCSYLIIFLQPLWTPPDLPIMPIMKASGTHGRIRKPWIVAGILVQGREGQLSYKEEEGRRGMLPGTRQERARRHVRFSTFVPHYGTGRQTEKGRWGERSNICPFLPRTRPSKTESSKFIVWATV